MATLLKRYVAVELKGIVVVGGPDAADGARAGAASALQLVANRPILCHALQELGNAGVGAVALVVPPEVSGETAAAVADELPATMQVHQIVCKKGTGIDGGLRSAVRFVGDAPCVVSVGDGLLGQPLAPMIELLEDGPSLVTFVHEGDADGDFVRLATHRLLRLAAPVLPNADLGLAGLCLFGPGALARVGDTHWCPGGDIDVARAAQRLVDGGGRLEVRLVRGWRRYAGAARDLLELNRYALDALAPEPGPLPSRDSRIDGRVMIDPTATVESSVIVGPAVIGARARVVESYIGPYTSVGEDVRIAGAELEHSIILAGASIMHVGGRLVSSVVGRDARIFRDFSLPRAIRLKVGDGVEVALC